MWQVDCAAREVFEEVGYDVTGKIHDKRYIDGKISSNKPMRMFIVPAVPENTKFETHTRKEISEIKWFKVSVLVAAMKNPDLTNNAGKKLRFYGIRPLIKTLLGWIGAKHIHGFGTSSSSNHSTSKTISSNHSTFNKTNQQSHQQHQTHQVSLKSRRPPKLKPDAHQQHDLQFQDLEDSFGNGRRKSGGWSAEAMFQANEQLFNVK